MFLFAKIFRCNHYVGYLAECQMMEPESALRAFHELLTTGVVK